MNSWRLILAGLVVWLSGIATFLAALPYSLGDIAEWIDPAYKPWLTTWGPVVLAIARFYPQIVRSAYGLINSFLRVPLELPAELQPPAQPPSPVPAEAQKP